MKLEALSQPALSYALYRLGTSKILFRGPKPDLDQDYVAFVGGSETFGRFVSRPFTTLAEQRLGLTAANFGVVNGSLDVLVKTPELIDACNNAVVTVLQVTGAHNMSNRFYSVHPRRNDRFVGASSVLDALFPDVDFTEHCFIGHLLQTLYSRAPDRFSIVIAEMQAAWTARMRRTLQDLTCPVQLLMIGAPMVEDAPFEDAMANPAPFVTQGMIDEVTQGQRACITIRPSSQSVANGTMGMHFAPDEADSAARAPSPAVHQEISDALVERLLNDDVSAGSG